MAQLAPARSIGKLISTKHGDRQPPVELKMDSNMRPTIRVFNAELLLHVDLFAVF